jgi:hypothetical protein
LADKATLDDLEILHSRQDLVLHAEFDFHTESGALLDGERLLLESLQSGRLTDINDNVGSALNFETKSENNAGTLVVGISNGVTMETQRLLPLAERLILSICRGQTG